MLKKNMNRTLLQKISDKTFFIYFIKLLNLTESTFLTNFKNILIFSMSNNVNHIKILNFIIIYTHNINLLFVLFYFIYLFI